MATPENIRCAKCKGRSFTVQTDIIGGEAVYQVRGGGDPKVVESSYDTGDELCGFLCDDCRGTEFEEIKKE